MPIVTIYVLATKFALKDRNGVSELCRESPKEAFMRSVRESLEIV
jgi:hypothetical protein